jgi:hypothetical protein
VYQVVISPIKWADKKAQEMAKQVERGILDSAEDGEGGDGNGGADARYPDLSGARRREEQCLPWPSGFRGQEDAPPNSVELEEKRPLEGDSSASAPGRE